MGATMGMSRGRCFLQQIKGLIPMRMLVAFFAICLLPALAASADGKDAASTKSLLGRSAPEFSLRDQYGKAHALVDYKRKRLVVLAFLGNECPLARLYAPRLEQIAAEYAP